MPYQRNNGSDSASNTQKHGFIQDLFLTVMNYIDLYRVSAMLWNRLRSITQIKNQDLEMAKTAEGVQNKK